MSETIYFLLTFSLLLCDVQSDDLPSGAYRETANGFVQGSVEISSMNQRYFAFRSVPYAEAPITGVDIYTKREYLVDRRFKAPEPLERTWDPYLQVQRFQNSCLESTSRNPTKEETGEDCLYLQIYVPDGGKKTKTVLVWLHGGGFTEGGHREDLYGPDFLLAQDNVVVYVQYRLGIFGFMNLDKGEYTGNMGLKDQQMALEWIHNNIHYFSGNRSEVLLFGQGAGGASTTFHMLNKKSRKYFKRAYAASGSVFSYFALTKGNHYDKMKECAQVLNWDKLVEYLQDSSAEDIVKCQFQNDWGLTLKPEWVPTIEAPDTPNAFITESPDFLWRSSITAPVMDAMFSYVSHDHLAFDPSLLRKSEPLIDGHFESKIRLPFDDFSQANYLTDYQQALRVLRYAYYSGDNSSVINENIALMSDLNFGNSVLKAAKLQADANRKKKNTFLFRFSTNAELNLNKFLHNSTYYVGVGAAHSDELCYIFHCRLFDRSWIYKPILGNKQSVGYKTMKRMVKLITNFARTGNPSIKGDTQMKSIPNSTETQSHDIELHYDAWRKVEHIYNARVNRCYQFVCKEGSL